MDMPEKRLLDESERAIGARVREFRDYVKWKQRDFAERLGLTRNQLTGIEAGRTRLKYSTGYRLCDLFDVNDHWLFTGKGEMTGFTDRDVLPIPEIEKTAALFSEIVHRQHAASSKLAAVERQRGGKGGVVEALAEALKDERFDWIERAQRKALEICERRHFESDADRQRVRAAIIPRPGEVRRRLPPPQDCVHFPGE